MSKGVIIMFSKFKNFDEMITPTIIKVIYWIGLGFFSLMGIIMFFSAFSRMGSFLNVIFAIFIIVFGALMTRVYCELLILGFKGVTHLANIDKKLDK